MALYFQFLKTNTPKLAYSVFDMRNMRLMTILELAGSTMAKECLLTDEPINKFFDRFFSKLPDYLQKQLLNTSVAL